MAGRGFNVRSEDVRRFLQATNAKDAIRLV